MGWILAEHFITYSGIPVQFLDSLMRRRPCMRISLLWLPLCRVSKFWFSPFFMLQFHSLGSDEIIGVGDGINRSSLVSFNCSRSKYGVFPHYFLTLCRPVLRFDSTGAYLGSGDKLTATHVFPNA